MQLTTNSIKGLFKCTTDICRRNVNVLIQEAEQILGGTEGLLERSDQWKIMSDKLNNHSKLTCLSDPNHRLMLIQFVRTYQANLYKSSYFNRAKIDEQYLNYLREIGPWHFSEVLKIVNKLKLIHKHYSQRSNEKMYSQNPIDMKIMKILQICNSKQRSINNNLSKFKFILEIEHQREELIKQLGKMLRQAWANQKKSTNEEEIQSQNVKTLPFEQDSNMEMIDMEYNIKYDSNRDDFDYYLQN